MYDTPGCWFVVGCFGVFPVVLCRAMAFASCFSRVFDTPVDALFSNGSRVVHEGPGCVDQRCAVDLSLAARHGGLAPGDWGGLLVWWWFENSRAYLYYFFIVNDCQSVLRPMRLACGCREAGQTGRGFCGQSVFLINGCRFLYF